MVGREEDEESRRVLEAVFGYYSSSGDEDSDHSHEDIHLRGEDNWRWEKVEEVDGLWFCKEFLSTEQQSWLLSSIDREGWFAESSHNQAMRFGDLPNWARTISDLIHRSCSDDIIFHSKGPENAEGNGRNCPLPMNILWREPLFDQLIANAYEPGEGICAHVDLMKFEDGIAIVSLQSMCVMHFTPVDDQPLGTRRIPVLLTPGSLVLMSGEARFLWKHEINRKSGFQKWEGEEITQHRRTSLTLRRLCQPANYKAKLYGSLGEREKGSTTGIRFTTTGNRPVHFCLHKFVVENSQERYPSQTRLDHVARHRIHLAEYLHASEKSKEEHDAGSQAHLHGAKAEHQRTPKQI